jgi:hypothetical protein
MAEPVADPLVKSSLVSSLPIWSVGKSDVKPIRHGPNGSLIMFIVFVAKSLFLVAPKRNAVNDNIRLWVIAFPGQIASL